MELSIGCSQPVLVVYYTCTGTARKAAKDLAARTGWPLGEVYALQPASRPRCVIDSLLRRRPSFRYSGPPLRDFGTVVLVGPIWGGHLSGPLRSFLLQNKLELENVALLLITRSNGATRVFREAAGILGRPPIACAGFRQQEVDEGAATRRLHAFADALQPSPAVMDAALGLARLLPAASPQPLMLEALP